MPYANREDRLKYLREYYKFHKEDCDRWQRNYNRMYSVRNYYRRRYKNDPEYRAKKLRQSKLSAKRHPETRKKRFIYRYYNDPEFREKQILYGRKWRLEHRDQCRAFDKRRNKDPKRIEYKNRSNRMAYLRKKIFNMFNRSIKK